MAMSSIHSFSLPPLFAAVPPLPYLVDSFSSPSLLLQWQWHGVLRARAVRAVLSHLQWYWTRYQVCMCVCACVLTREPPSLPNNCISVPWCDTSGRTNTGGMLTQFHTHMCAHTHKHTHTCTIFPVHVPSSEQLSDSLFLVLLLHREGEKMVIQWHTEPERTGKRNKIPHIHGLFHTHTTRCTTYTSVLTLGPLQVRVWSPRHTEILTSNCKCPHL